MVISGGGTSVGGGGAGGTDVYAVNSSLTIVGDDTWPTVYATWYSPTGRLDDAEYDTLTAGEGAIWPNKGQNGTCSDWAPALGTRTKRSAVSKRIGATFFIGRD